MARTDTTQDRPAHTATLARRLNAKHDPQSAGLTRKISDSKVYLWITGPSTIPVRDAEFLVLQEILTSLGYRATLEGTDHVPYLYVITPGTPLTPRQAAKLAADETAYLAGQAQRDADAAAQAAADRADRAEHLAALRLAEFARLHPAAAAAVAAQEQNRDDTAAELQRGDAQRTVTSADMWWGVDADLRMYTDGDETLLTLLTAALRALGACTLNDLYAVKPLDAIRAPFTRPAPAAVTTAMAPVTPVPDAAPDATGTDAARGDDTPHGFEQVPAHALERGDTIVDDPTTPRAHQYRATVTTTPEETVDAYGRLAVTMETTTPDGPGRSVLRSSEPVWRVRTPRPAICTNCEHDWDHLWNPYGSSDDYAQCPSCGRRSGVGYDREGHTELLGRCDNGGYLHAYA